MIIRTKYNLSFVALLLLSLFAGTIIVALLTKTSSLFISQALYFCQKLVSNTLFQIPNSLLGGFLFIPGLILTAGVLSFLVQLGKTYQLLRQLSARKIRIPLGIRKMIDSLNLNNKVSLVEDNRLFSFCSGILSPRIIITTGLTLVLNEKELEAVLLHEQAHLRSRDPLKVLFGKTIASMFFFLPLFSELHKNMEGASELLADSWTVANQESATFLKGALKKILATPQVSITGVPAVANLDHLELRIQKIVNPSLQTRFSVSSVSAITSILFVVMSWFMLQTPVGAFQAEHSSEPSYFLCSSDNACRQECNTNAQKSSVSNPEDLFYKEK